VSTSSSGAKLYYIRHGQTDWNAELRFQGQRDIPLNDFGRAQAKRNGQKLFEKIGKGEDCTFISSPLSRTRETMEIIRGEMGLDKSDYALDKRLVEISYGDFEGKTKPELKKLNREMFLNRKQNAWNFRPNNGESQADTLVRVAQWYDELDANKTYVVTAHGAVGRVVRYYLLGLSEQEAATFVFPQDEVFEITKGSEIRF
jgi:probable phosphoglycerate mutase